MDLTRQPPRRPSNTSVAGIVGIARMADKARAAEDETIGDHLYGDASGLDSLLLEYLGVPEKDFQDAAVNNDDGALGAWVLQVSGKSDQEVEAFNTHHLTKEPDDEGGKERLRQRVERFAPGRTDINTVFQSIELDDVGSFQGVDLAAGAPRTPYDRSVAHTCALARMSDKARADKADKLNDYIYNCPIDQAVMAFLGLSADAFQEAAWNNPNDTELGDWISSQTTRSQEDIAGFNVTLINRGPEDDDEQGFFTASLNRVAPGRTDITTWFQLLDLDDEFSYGAVDLTRHAPRSPYDRSILGAVGVARLVDKGRAHLSGTLGDYWYGSDSGADLAVLRSLGVTLEDFEQALRDHATDTGVDAWLRTACEKSAEEIEAYNQESVGRGPSNERGRDWYRGFVAGFDPKRKDLTTYYQIMQYADHIEFAKLHSGI